VLNLPTYPFSWDANIDRSKEKVEGFEDLSGVTSTKDDAVTSKLYGETHRPLKIV
jgi:hypothetical protein